MLEVDSNYYGTQQKAFLIQRLLQRFMYKNIETCDHEEIYIYIYIIKCFVQLLKVGFQLINKYSLIIQVLGNKFHNKLLEIIDPRLWFLLYYYWNVLLSACFRTLVTKLVCEKFSQAANCQSFLVELAHALMMAGVLDQTRDPGITQK